MQNAPVVGGAVFFIIWLIMMFGMVGGYIVMIMALWRGMKAHESIAETLENYLQAKQVAVEQQED